MENELGLLADITKIRDFMRVLVERLKEQGYGEESKKPTTTIGHPYQIGKVYFIRTVTFHYTGVLKSVGKQELVLTDCAWIADDGRFATALETGVFNEVEPFPDGDVIIGRGSILDAHVLKHAALRKQK